jgi:hypothetical protein
MNQTQRLESMQIWLPDGIECRALNKPGMPLEASDLLSDIVYFILTQSGRGMRDLIPPEMVDVPSFAATGKFLNQYRLYFNGAIADRVNLRTYINQLAPYFLSNFSIRNGMFFMTPGVPTDEAGRMLETAVPISAYFNEGNIVDETFTLQYLDASERRDFRCVVKYRESIKNGIPQERTLQMSYADRVFPQDQEDHDVTAFCTSTRHAELIARYLLSTRRRIDHTIEFQTSPFGMALAPGDYIKVETTSSPLEININARVDGDLKVIGSVQDGTYEAIIYRQASDSVKREQITVVNGRVEDKTLAFSLFAIPLAQRRLGVYMVEELSLGDNGMVDVKASHHPVDVGGRSKIVLDLLSTDSFSLVD